MSPVLLQMRDNVHYTPIEWRQKCTNPLYFYSHHRKVLQPVYAHKLKQCCESSKAKRRALTVWGMEQRNDLFFPVEN